MKIDLNGITINYLERGLSQEFPLIFIHGFPFSNKMWEPQMSSLPNNIRAIAYDIRGHGLSDVGDGQYTSDILVDDLIALLDYLKIEKAVLCGLSMGGYIALRAYELNPNRIRGLILCDTKSDADTNEAKIKRSAMVKIIKQFGVDIFANEFLKQIFWDETFNKNPEVVEYIKNIILSNSPIGICGTLIALAARTDTSHILPLIDVPTCIIVGQYDKLIPYEIAQSMQRNIRKSELFIIPNAGHISNLENSNEFNKKLISFIKTNWQLDI